VKKIFHYSLLFTFLAVFLAVSLILYYESRYEVRLNAWQDLLVDSMYFYLVFIFFRTALHLVLAFASLFFSKGPKSLKSYPLVSILIPCYNEDKVVREALLSVKRLTYPNYEIIVIDDGSNDVTLDEISSLHSHNPGENARIRIVHQENAGKAEALNRGIMEAQGEFILSLDADSSLSPDVIEQSLPLLLNNEKIAAVAGTVKVGNLINPLTKFQALEYISGLNLYKEAQSFLGVVTVIPGPVGLFRKSMVIECGGYKSDTLAEDCELTLRLLIHGYRTVYSPNMVARTEVPDEYADLMGQRYRWSRGVLKAIKVNSEWLFKPWKNIRNFLILMYMLVESFIIPTVNFIFSFVSINYALVFGVKGLYGYFFGQLILLDLILALFCLIMEKDQRISLMLYALLNRFTYGMSLEILRFFALFDEILGLPLSWGKLIRKGM
jgi:poly-beta-1,6-N-acetyl-D-glucosamine synthase